MCRLTRWVPQSEHERFEFLCPSLVFSGVSFGKSLVFCVLLCCPLFSFLSPFYLPLCSLYFLDLQFLLTFFVSSIFTCRVSSGHVIREFMILITINYSRFCLFSVILVFCFTCLSFNISCFID